MHVTQSHVPLRSMKGDAAISPDATAAHSQ